MQKKGHLPERRCSACGRHAPKGELIRVLRRSEDGELVLDPDGRGQGRGAYICRSAECLKKVRRSRRIEYCLGKRVPESIYDEIDGIIKSDSDK